MIGIARIKPPPQLQHIIFAPRAIACFRILLKLMLSALNPIQNRLEYIKNGQKAVFHYPSFPCESRMQAPKTPIPAIVPAKAFTPTS